MNTAKPAKASTMASNYSFPAANSLAQRQSGHRAIYLPGNTKTPPPLTQQELDLARVNHLLDSGPLHQEEEQSSSDDADSNIDHQLCTRGQPNALTQHHLRTQVIPVPCRRFPQAFLRSDLNVM